MTFTAENVPTQVYQTEVYDLTVEEARLDWDDTVDITGEWRVDPDGRLYLFAYFPDSGNTRGFYLYASGAGADLELYSPVGDPDLNIRFGYKKLQ